MYFKFTFLWKDIKESHSLRTYIKNIGRHQDAVYFRFNRETVETGTIPLCVKENIISALRIVSGE
jgi:hypothetical protein